MLVLVLESESVSVSERVSESVLVSERVSESVLVWAGSRDEHEHGHGHEHGHAHGHGHAHEREHGSFSVSAPVFPRNLGGAPLGTPLRDS